MITHKAFCFNTPNASLFGNSDIGITMGGTPGKLRFYTDKNIYGEPIRFVRAALYFPVGWLLP